MAAHHGRGNGWAVYEIPLVNDQEPVNFIMHLPSGDTVPDNPRAWRRPVVPADQQPDRLDHAGRPHRLHQPTLNAIDRRLAAEADGSASYYPVVELARATRPSSHTGSGDS